MFVIYGHVEHLATLIPNCVTDNKMSASRTLIVSLRRLSQKCGYFKSAGKITPPHYQSRAMIYQRVDFLLTHVKISLYVFLISGLRQRNL